jgi:hypothetical protein
MNKKNRAKETGGIHFVMPPRVTATTMHGGYRKTLTDACCPNAVTITRGITYGDVERDWIEINGVKMSLEVGREQLLPLLGISPLSVSKKVIMPAAGRGVRRSQQTSSGRVLDSVRSFGGRRRLKAAKKTRRVNR